MQPVRTWSSLVFSSFCFVLLALILRDFHFIFSSSFLRLMSRIEGVMGRGWMTSPLCLFRIVWRQGAGQNWRTQGRDGSQGSRVPGGLVGRTWLYYSYHKLLPLPGGCFVLCFACYFPCFFSPWFFFVSLCLHSGVFLFSSFFPARCFHLPYRLRGGGHDSLFLLFFFIFSFFFFVSFDLSSSFFCFLFDCSLSFLYFIECVCRFCCIYSCIHINSMITSHCIADSCAYCILVPGTWQRRISVA